jgi:hypothetical protein
MLSLSCEKSFLKRGFYGKEKFYTIKMRGLREIGG